jgi:hypothetical protein
MNKYEIKNATAEYTGGGIYIYYGELTNGLYFRTWDASDYIAICDADTSTDEAEYEEFYEAHVVDSLFGDDFKKFFNNIIIWIDVNEPEGNYNIGELDSRMYRLFSEKMYYKNIIDFMKYLNQAVVDMDEKPDEIYQYTIDMKCNDKHISLEWGATEVNSILDALESIVADSGEIWNDIITETTYDPHQNITFIWSNTYYHGELKEQELQGFYHGEPDNNDTMQFKNKLKATY